ncbi:MAG: hypothetical protein GFH27_549311n146 [Chloroflexi bacterium AL-W]|nr:hypothetical protein [Chloroflexi bacterium AL-N1]NOK68676.1 hypothetical protein [Chloroflexi bacterium AL-N10]NOK76162.1 hypothetical protein [Chloroflexi bacterium AL-N5]NOK84201.1 hypothetical protein [Chloroflexi bacterium AL-W]NOK91300.1 hypothetical protein [Chloroflexi bacterium AL-N15]
MSTEWSKPAKYIVGVALALLVIGAIYISRPVIPLLIIAALLAYIVSPIVRWLHLQVKMPQGVAVLLTYLGVIVTVPIVIGLLIPSIVNAVNNVLTIDYQQLVVRSINWTRNVLLSIEAVEIPFAPLDNSIDETIGTFLLALDETAVADAVALPTLDNIFPLLGSAITATFGVAVDLIGSALALLIVLIFILLASIYMSLSAHTYVDGMLKVVPEPFRPEIATLFERIGTMWNAFFRGQLTLMITIGIIVWIGLEILGIPGAFGLAIVAGLLEVVPNLGPVLATIPAVLVALIQGSTVFDLNHGIIALIVIGFYVLVQQLENAIIVPRILGEAVDLPPLVVMSGVLIFASFGGILGALLAAPIIASAIEIIRYAYRKILGEPPFPDPDEKATEPERDSQQNPLSTLIERIRAMLSQGSRPPQPEQRRPPQPEQRRDK